MSYYSSDALYFVMNIAALNYWNAQKSDKFPIGLKYLDDVISGKCGTTLVECYQVFLWVSVTHEVVLGKVDVLILNMASRKDIIWLKCILLKAKNHLELLRILFCNNCQGVKDITV